MKKMLVLMLNVIICIWIIGCSKTSEEMPGIVFGCVIEDKDGYYSEYMIDNLGNVYYSNSTVLQVTYWELEEKYKAGKVQLHSRLVDTIDEVEVQKKYSILNKIVKKGEYGLVEPEGVEEPPIEVSRYKWYAVCYDEDGELVYVPLYVKEKDEKLSKDERAKELADWISEVCNIK